MRNPTMKAGRDGRGKVQCVHAAAKNGVPFGKREVEYFIIKPGFRNTDHDVAERG